MGAGDGCPGPCVLYKDIPDPDKKKEIIIAQNDHPAHMQEPVKAGVGPLNYLWWRG